MIRIACAAAMLLSLGLAPAWAADSCPNSDVLRPVSATHTLPPYPELSVSTEEEGTTLLMVHIGTDGVPDDVKVDVSSGSLRLDEAAQEFVKATWRWQPPIHNCKPVDVSTRVSIKWSLKDAPQDQTPMASIAVTKADFPSQALARHEQGTTMVYLIVGVDGTVVRSQVVNGSGFTDLDDKALEIARQRHWTAAKMDGAAIVTMLEVFVRWQIDPPASPKP